MGNIAAHIYMYGLRVNLYNIVWLFASSLIVLPRDYVIVVSVNFPAQLIVQLAFVDSNHTAEKARLVLHSLVLAVICKVKVK